MNSTSVPRSSSRALTMAPKRSSWPAESSAGVTPNRITSGMPEGAVVEDCPFPLHAASTRARAASMERSRRLVREPNPDSTLLIRRSAEIAEVAGLRLDVLEDSLGARLSAQPRLLEAAEGRLRGGRQPVVDRDHPELEFFRHLERRGHVPGVNVCGQPVVRVVGAGDGGIDVVERDDRHHRAEDLLVVD